MIAGWGLMNLIRGGAWIYFFVKFGQCLVI